MQDVETPEVELKVKVLRAIRVQMEPSRRNGGEFRCSVVRATHPPLESRGSGRRQRDAEAAEKLPFIRNIKQRAEIKESVPPPVSGVHCCATKWEK